MTAVDSESSHYEGTEARNTYSDCSDKKGITEFVSELQTMTDNDRSELIRGHRDEDGSV